MSYWEDLDDHLRWLEPNDLNLDYMGVTHLDCVSRVAQGAKGIPGLRGPPGTKGEPGESISLPSVVISPVKQTVRENQRAAFQCSVSGNPQPTMIWVRGNGTHLKSDSHLGARGGRLEVHNVTLSDAGKYTCVGRNILGSESKSAKLIVEGRNRY